MARKEATASADLSGAKVITIRFPTYTSNSVHVPGLARIEIDNNSTITIPCNNLTLDDGVVAGYTKPGIRTFLPGSHVLKEEASLLPPPGGTIAHPGGCKTFGMELPVGTVVTVRSPEVPLRAYLLYTAILKKRHVLDRGGMELTQGLSVPTGSVVILGKDGCEIPDSEGCITLDGPIVLTSSMVNGTTYYPEGTLLSTGISLWIGTWLPGGTVLPSQMMIPKGTILPEGTILPAQTILPINTKVPSNFTLPDHEKIEMAGHQPVPKSATGEKRKFKVEDKDEEETELQKKQKLQ